MAHKALIGGTAYEIKGGRDLIGGTVHSKKNGKALINGTAYAIKFGASLTWTIQKDTSALYDSLDVSVNFTATDGTRLIRFVVRTNYIIFYTNGDGERFAYNNGRWIDKYLTITFDEPPTGTLLTWLQAHAKPQD